MASGQNSHSKASLFLIELIISLFFFSLASVVCVRLFLYAHKVSTDSRRETLAVQISQNAAECFIAADGVEEEFLKLYDLTLSSGGGETGGKTGNAPQEEIRTSFTVREDTDAAGPCARSKSGTRHRTEPRSFPWRCSTSAGTREIQGTAAALPERR